MRIFAFGDFHFGDSRYSWVEEQEKQLLSWVSRQFWENDCDLFVILGDVFRSKMHSEKDKDRVFRFLSDLTEKVDSVVLIAGNHDYYDKECNESGVRIFQDIEGLRVVDDVGVLSFKKRVKLWMKRL